MKYIINKFSQHLRVKKKRLKRTCSHICPGSTLHISLHHPKPTCKVKSWTTREDKRWLSKIPIHLFFPLLWGLIHIQALSGSVRLHPILHIWCCPGKWRTSCEFTASNRVYQPPLSTSQSVFIVGHGKKLLAVSDLLNWIGMSLNWKIYIIYWQEEICRSMRLNHATCNPFKLNNSWKSTHWAGKTLVKELCAF